MTFTTAVWAVDGNAVDAAYARLMLQAATLGAQGVVGHLDCIVRATATPSAGITIDPGQVVIQGVEASYQGSYHSWNIGLDSTLTIGATGGSIRSDMIVARAEDPTWSGSPWGNPASGQIVFPRVISGVSAGATTPPGGQSCIPLARIDMPASTSVVQNSYIHDLRQVAIPQTQTVQLFAAGPGSPTNWTTSSSTAVRWPPGASWQVPIPAWATTCILMWQIGEAGWNSGWARGFVWPVFGASVTAPTVAFPQTLTSIQAAAGPYRHTLGGGGQVAIPASIRGTTQTLQMAQISTPSGGGIMGVDEGGGTSIVLTFQQSAAVA